jgi:hypothetical protein
MAAKAASGFSLKLTGPGVSFERPVSDDIANRIINLVMTGSSAAQSPALPPGTPGGMPPGTPAQNPGQLAGTSIKQFIAQKRPANMYQRVACLAYHLTHASGLTHFNTKDITKANTDAAVSKLTNPAARVGDATTKYHYLSHAGGGSWPTRLPQIFLTQFDFISLARFASFMTFATIEMPRTWLTASIQIYKMRPS